MYSTKWIQPKSTKYYCSCHWQIVYCKSWIIFPLSFQIITLKISHVNKKHDCDGKNVFRCRMDSRKRAHAEHMTAMVTAAENSKTKTNKQHNRARAPITLPYNKRLYTVCTDTRFSPSILCTQYTMYCVHIWLIQLAKYDIAVAMALLYFLFAWYFIHKIFEYKCDLRSRVSIEYNNNQIHYAN